MNVSGRPVLSPAGGAEGPHPADPALPVGFKPWGSTRTPIVDQWGRQWRAWRRVDPYGLKR
jgi:hypothetical protein